MCIGDGGRVVLRTASWRLIHAGEAAWPGFYRLVWNTHVAELSDLRAVDRAACLDAVCAIESAMRRHLSPTKMNLASLGNQVPHLHWHLVARFDWDTHFPAPLWAAPVRQPAMARLADLQARLPALEDDLRSRAFA
nr:HIT family protein [Ramlibacter aurantiacus]